jgi:acyl-coenzyme A thioesterase PaaI-like protein
VARRWQFGYGGAVMGWASERLEALFFRLSRNEQITIDARVVAQSRQLISVEAEFRNPGGELLAKASAQQMLIVIPKSQDPR